jgi:hypothetical protein
LSAKIATTGSTAPEVKAVNPVSQGFTGMANGAASTGVYKTPMEVDLELDINKDPTTGKVVGYT